MAVKKILNLTGHDIKIVTDDGKVIKVFESNGLLRLTFDIVKVGEIDGVDIVERKVVDFEVSENVDLESAEAVIVSAQSVSFIKEKFPHLKVYTVGETVREKKEDGTVTILGAKNLILN